MLSISWPSSLSLGVSWVNPSELSATAVFAVGLSVMSVLLWPGSTARRAVAAVTRLGAARPSSSAHEVDPPGVTVRILLFRRLARLPRRRSARSGLLDSEVLVLLDALAASLAAGLPAAEAVRSAVSADTGGELVPMLVPVTQAALDGRPTGPAWERVATRAGNVHLTALAHAWTVSERLGCPLADAVRQTASSCRSSTLVQQRIASATAGTRATTTLLSLLPIGGLAAAPLLGIDPLRLYGTPVAVGCLAAGVLLLVMGRWTVERMIRTVATGAT